MSQRVNQKELLQKLEQFLELFEKELKTVNPISAESEIIEFLLHSFSDILEDGFQSHEEVLEDTHLNYWQPVSDALNSHSVYYVNSVESFSSDFDRAFVWILIELHKKNLLSVFQQISANDVLMQEYSSDAIVKQHKKEIEDILGKLMKLDYQIESQFLQAYEEREMTGQNSPVDGLDRHPSSAQSSHKNTGKKSDYNFESPKRGSNNESANDEEAFLNSNDRKKSHKISEFRRHLERYKNLLEGKPLGNPNGGMGYFEDDSDDFTWVNKNYVTPGDPKKKPPPPKRKMSRNVDGLISPTRNRSKKDSHMNGMRATASDEEFEYNPDTHNDIDKLYGTSKDRSRTTAINREEIQHNLTTPGSHMTQSTPSKPSNSTPGFLDKLMFWKSSNNKLDHNKKMSKNVVAAYYNNFNGIGEGGIQEKSNKTSTNMYNSYVNFDQYGDQKLKNSQLLYLERYQSLEKIYEYRDPPAIKLKPEDQEYKCYNCGQPINKFLFFLKSRNFYCEYTGHWFCSECMVKDKMLIPWQVRDKFDFTKYHVSKEASQELKQYYDKPNIKIDYKADIVAKNKILYDTLVMRRQIHLMYDLICETPFIVDLLGNNANFLLKENLFSMKQMVEIKDGALLQYLETYYKKLEVHMNGCNLCLKKAKTCKICEDKKKIFLYDIKNTSICPKCKTLSHKLCLMKHPCVYCKYNN